jgi:hypothetical protein
MKLLSWPVKSSSGACHPETRAGISAGFFAVKLVNSSLDATTVTVATSSMFDCP